MQMSAVPKVSERSATAAMKSLIPHLAKFCLSYTLQGASDSALDRLWKEKNAEQ